MEGVGSKPREHTCNPAGEGPVQDRTWQKHRQGREEAERWQQPRAEPGRAEGGSAGGRPRRVWTEQKAMMWRNQAAQSRAQGGRDNRGMERRDKVQGKGWKAGGREGACGGDVA